MHAGKKANDPQGFARGHAKQALARLDGKPLPPLSAFKAGSVRKEALSSLPADMTLAAGYDLRADGDSSAETIDGLRNLFGQAIPPKERVGVYDVVDVVGNVRLDRGALGMRLDERANPQKVVVHLSGFFRAEAVAQMIAFPFKGRVTPEKVKGPGGEEIVVLDTPAVAVALVGGSEVLVAVDPNTNKHRPVLDEALAVRAGKQKNVLDSPLGELLKDVPAGSRVVVVGALPEVARKGMLEKDSPFRAAPTHFVFQGVTKERLEMGLTAHLKNKEEAEGFAESAIALKQMGLMALDRVPAEANIPPAFVKELKENLKGLKIAAEGTTVSARGAVDAGVFLRALLTTFTGRAKMP